MPKRKTFIDKKRSVAFRLVHRSQKDPLIALDDAQMVLAPVEGVEKLRITEQHKTPLSSEERKSEQVKCGVYFEDDYDYLQHLKDANEVYSLEPVQQRFRIFTDGQAVDAGQDIAAESSSGLSLPSHLFESQGLELKVGLLNQAAPQHGPHPELDPDIVAALDDDNYNFSDPDNQLEDDFIVKANASAASTDHRFTEVNDDDSDVGSSGTLQSDRESESDYEDQFEEEETKSRFTNYSLTSSVMRRSQGLQQVDARFEKLYEQYDDEEVGDLDTVEEEITGFLDPDGQRMQHLIDEYEEDTRMKKKAAEMILNEKKTEDLIAHTNFNAESDEDLEKVYVEERPKEQWDCESVLSTYSNIYNRPTLISEPKTGKQKIKLNNKTGLPQGVLKSSSLAPVLRELDAQQQDVNDDDDDDDDKVEDMDCGESKASTVRSKFETPDQKRLRKQAVKFERKERRIEKKSNKLAFKSEAKRRHCVQLNLQNNLAGVKLL